MRKQCSFFNPFFNLLTSIEFSFENTFYWNLVKNLMEKLLKISLIANFFSTKEIFWTKSPRSLRKKLKNWRDKNMLSSFKTKKCEDCMFFLWLRRARQNLADARLLSHKQSSVRTHANSWLIHFSFPRQRTTKNVSFCMFQTKIRIFVWIPNETSKSFWNLQVPYETMNLNWFYF